MVLFWYNSIGWVVLYGAILVQFDRVGGAIWCYFGTIR